MERHEHRRKGPPHVCVSCNLSSTLEMDGPTREINNGMTHNMNDIPESNDKKVAAGKLPQESCRTVSPSCQSTSSRKAWPGAGLEILHSPFKGRRLARRWRFRRSAHGSIYLLRRTPICSCLLDPGVLRGNT